MEGFAILAKPIGEEGYFLDAANWEHRSRLVVSGEGREPVKNSNWQLNVTVLQCRRVGKPSLLAAGTLIMEPSSTGIQ